MEVTPRKRPYATEMEKLQRWLKKMGINEQMKPEWRPPCSIAKNYSDGDILSMFRTSTGWRIEKKVLQRLIPGIEVSAGGLKNDFEEMD